MEICAIIPARGGSKAIKKKNLQCVGSKPLIIRTIEAARKSKWINRIVVSTDDKQISELAQTYGSEIIERPTEISGDDATSESALLHVLNKLEKEENYYPDIIVFLQCTSPFTTSGDIDGTINALINNKADSAFAATEFYKFLWKYDNNGSVIGINHNEKRIRKRRQDVNLQYQEAGSVYAFITNGFLINKNRFFGKIIVYSIPTERVFEIDNETELINANIIAKNSMS